jgi:hypothetical protein
MLIPDIANPLREKVRVENVLKGANYSRFWEAPTTTEEQSRYLTVRSQQVDGLLLFIIPVTTKKCGLKAKKPIVFVPNAGWP